MNERPTPETDAAKAKAYSTIDFGGCEDWCSKDWRCNGCKSRLAVDEMATVCANLERQLAELREIYDLDTQTLRAERDEAREALRARIGHEFCPECKMTVGAGHYPSCKHYATEREVMQ